jgi:hypothetical protein
VTHLQNHTVTIAYLKDLYIIRSSDSNKIKGSKAKISITKMRYSMHIHLFSPCGPEGWAILRDLTTNSQPGDGNLTTNCCLKDRQLTNSCTG